MSDDTQTKILMVSYHFPPYCVPGAALRLVKYLKYIARAKPDWKIEVVHAGFGADEVLRRADAEVLLQDVPKMVRTVKIADPGIAAAGSSRIKKVTDTILGKAPPVIGFFRRLIGSKKPKDIEPIPDSQITWNNQVKRAYINRAGTQFDLIYVTAPPYSSSILGVELKYILGNIPLIVDMRDDWSYLWKQYSDHRYDVEKAMEQQVINTASTVILTSEAGRRVYEERYPKIEHITMIPNGVDLEDFTDIDLTATQPIKFKIACAGMLDDLRDPSDFLRAFKQFINDPDVDASKCEIHFPETMPDKYWKLVGELGIGDYVFRTRILDREEYVRHLSYSAVLLSINYYDATTLIPSNLYEYWAVGRPVLLLERPGAAAALVRKNGLGAVADPHDVDWIASELKKLFLGFRSGDLSVPDKQAIKQFSREKLTDKLISIMDEQIRMKRELGI